METENKLEIAEKFISKFQLKNEELACLIETKESGLHPVNQKIHFLIFGRRKFKKKKILLGILQCSS